MLLQSLFFFIYLYIYLIFFVTTNIFLSEFINTLHISFATLAISVLQILDILLNSYRKGGKNEQLTNTDHDVLHSQLC